MTTFRVGVTREDGRWVAVVDGLRGGATETRTLINLEIEVRDLISGLTDAEPDSFSLEWHWEEAVGSDSAAAMAEFTELRKQLEETKAGYERAQRKAVVSLRKQGVSVRDAARLLGLSFQRVQQLDKT
ncbi:DNA-directed RNA polymerase specialized sigma24 family protein [Spinactinospora alkalitolerans]|uniref:DNA-directed RNA polymerase specialized sigma24 family protein n=1 Tax=Spinactinospora alkalitolerans TaxID=687207 RepID=A0A852TYI5_9ACTN|nr:helix-turn-helix domain-containing protein [Spinactinospora alkalitolerans]NYE46890.1 DNA-directed RNA polymerase specialized sigma24 family protein [Spinactinospora alkalitolerans]